MEDKVRAYVKKHRMFRQKDVVFAGVSGGGDSMAMLQLLMELKAEYELEVRVVHVHHGIRGDEAERDWELVETFCRERHIPCSIYRFQVPEMAAEWKLGEEETGRIVRRQAFELESKNAESDGKRVCFALAHNKNDQAETVLHNLARGTGLRGAAGIMPVSGKIVRPLLCLERTEIEEYLQNKQIPYVTDSTNLEDSYTRNRIRHHILPSVCKNVNEQAVAHIAEAAEKMAAADAYFTIEGKKLAEQFETGNQGYCLTGEFWDAAEIIQQYAVMEMLEKLAGRRKNFTAFHVEQILKMESFQTGKHCRVPYGITVKKQYGCVIISKEDQQHPETDFFLKKNYEKEIHLDVSEFFDSEDLSMEIITADGQKIFEKKYTKWLDYDKIQTGLTVRNRKTGDYIVIDQDGKRKKISRYMIDEKIPHEIRDEVCMLADGSEIMWIIGGRINERYKVTEKTTTILRVKYKGGNDNE